MLKTLVPKQVEQLETEGFCPPVRVFESGEMAAYREQLEGVERSDPNLAVRIEQLPHLILPWMSRLVKHPPLVNAWRDLFGDNLLLTSTALRRKEPGAGQYAGWHQDTFYIRYEPAWYVCLVAITEQTVANGCLHLIPGSHRWPLLTHKDGKDRNSVLTRGQNITEAFDESNAVGVEMAPGEVMFFHPGIVHGSPPNHSEQRRVLLLVEVCPPQTKRLGTRGRANILRGEDTHGHFDLLPWPRVACGAHETATHRLACQSRADEMYAGSERTPAGLR